MSMDGREAEECKQERAIQTDGVLPTILKCVKCNP